MESTMRACYTPEEVLSIVFDNKISLSTLRTCIRKGTIPSIRLGEGSRSRILIPGSYVREMQDKGFCEGK